MMRSSVRQLLQEDSLGLILISCRLQERKQMSTRKVLFLSSGLGLSVVLVAIAIVVTIHAQKRAFITSCANNLSQLWRLQNTYANYHGEPKGRMPLVTGKSFWLALMHTSPPLIDQREQSIYWCPVRGDDNGTNVHYLGPPISVSLLNRNESVGCDESGNHGKGGNVLRKSGDVIEVLEHVLNGIIEGHLCIP